MFQTRIASTGLFLLTAVLISSETAWPDEIRRAEPGRKLKVFLCAGQSNMEGRADGQKLTQNDRARLEQVQTRVQLAFNAQPVRPLDVVQPSPEIAQLYQRDRIFGPELFFGISVAEAWPNEQILIIKLAAGGTSLHGCWNPDWQVSKATVMAEENSQKLYPEFLSYVAGVLEPLHVSEYEICAMLWVQGETDSANPVAADAYGDNLGNLIQRVRQDLKRESLPFLLFEVGRGPVVEGMQKVARQLPDVVLIPRSHDQGAPDYYATMRNGHYNYEGMKKLGHSFARAFLQHVNE